MNYRTHFPASLFASLINGFDSLDVYQRNEGDKLFGPTGIQAEEAKKVEADPVVIHLLGEIALEDSKKFKLLSYEDMESLKRKSEDYAFRISALRRKLTLEDKLREAAASFARLLVDRNNSESQIGSNFGKDSSTKLSIKPSNRDNFDDSTTSSFDEELISSIRACDELATDLYITEKKYAKVQVEMLGHTAAILRVYHACLEESQQKKVTHRRTRSNSTDNGINQYSGDEVYYTKTARGTVGKKKGLRTDAKLLKLDNTPMQITSKDINPSMDFDSNVFVSRVPRLKKRSSSVTSSSTTVIPLETISPIQATRLRNEALTPVLGYLDNLFRMLKANLNENSDELTEIFDEQMRNEASEKDGDDLPRIEGKIKVIEQAWNKLVEHNKLQAQLASEARNSQDETMRALTDLWKKLSEASKLVNSEKFEDRDRGKVMSIELVSKELDCYIKHTKELKTSYEGIKEQWDMLQMDRDGKIEEMIEMRRRLEEVEDRYAEMEEGLEAERKAHDVLKEKQQSSKLLSTKFTSHESNLEKEKEELEKKVEELMDEVKKFRGDLKNAETELSYREESNKSLEKELEMIRANQGESVSKIEDAEAAAEAARVQLEASQREFETLQDNVRRLEKEVFGVKADRDRANEKVESMKEEVEKLRGDLENLAARNTELVIELAGGERSNSSVGKVAEPAKSKVNEEDYDGLKAENEMLREELKETLEQLEELTITMIYGEKERKTLEVQLDEYREQVHRLEGEVNRKENGGEEFIKSSIDGKNSLSRKFSRISRISNESKQENYDNGAISRLKSFGLGIGMGLGLGGTNGRTESTSINTSRGRREASERGDDAPERTYVEDNDESDYGDGTALYTDKYKRRREGSRREVKDDTKRSVRRTSNTTAQNLDAGRPNSRSISRAESGVGRADGLASRTLQKEFKRVLRESKAESMRVIMAEQNKRREVESQLRKLRYTNQS